MFIVVRTNKFNGDKCYVGDEALLAGTGSSVAWLPESARRFETKAEAESYVRNVGRWAETVEEV